MAIRPEVIKRGATHVFPVEVYEDPDTLVSGAEAVRAVLKAAPDAVEPGDAAPDAAVLALEWRSPLGAGLQKGWLCTLSSGQSEALAAGTYVFDFRMTLAGGIVYSRTVLVLLTERVTEAA